MRIIRKQSLPILFNKGFTLVEMLVVLGIVAMMLAVVPPMLSNSIDHSRVKSATRQLAAGLKQARIKAINSREEATLELDTSNGSFHLDDMDKSLGLPADASLLLTTAQTEQLNDHSGAIRFFPDGSSTGGQIKISLKDRFEFIVDINWLTGKVTITP